MSPPSTSTQNLESHVAIATIRKASMIIALLASAATAVIYGYFADNPMYGPSSMYAAVLMTVLGWGIFGLSHLVSAHGLAVCLVFSVQAIATYTLIGFGSVRGAATMMILATVVGAGLFLSKRVLVLSWLSGMALLGVVTYLETTGRIAPKSLQSTSLTWFVFAAVLTALAMLVFSARQRTRKAFGDQLQALEDNKRLAEERDRGLERFARIFQSSPSPMAAQSATTGQIVDVNPAFERCYGLRKEDVVGQTDERLWALPEQRAQHLLEIRTHKRAERADARGLRADGSTFEGHIHSEWASDSEDALVITTITDMSALNGVLRRLRRSEERFSKAFHFSPLNLIITRQSDDTVVEVNRTRLLLATAPDTSLIGLPASQVVPWFTAEGRETFFKRLTTQGYLHGYDTRLVRPDGSAIDARIWAEQIELDEGSCVLSCVVDATDEKRREAMLRDIAQGMTGQTAQAFFKVLTERMSHALGADMVVIGELADAKNVQTLSVSRRGVNAPNFVFSIDGKLCERSLAQREPMVLDSGAREDSAWNALEDPTSFQGAICQALHDAEGNPIGLLNALWTHPIEPDADMLALMSIFASRANAEMMRLRSERYIEQLNETLEQRVRERTAELRKLNKDLDSFAYSISHDLKSPLRAIDGFTQLLSERLDGRLDDEERHLMSRVLGSTHRMATLMADLLALTRVSQVPMHRERINLSDLATEVFENKLRQEPRPQVRWKVAPGVFGDGDIDLTRRLLEHLIDNALKFTRDQASPLIEFGQTPQHPQSLPDAPAQFFVKDNGAGFSMAHADKLFKPFQRLHMPDAGFEGTGIGLATVRRIVERHGGDIEGQAQVDQGAEFRFSLHSPLPLATEDQLPSEHKRQIP